MHCPCPHKIKYPNKQEAEHAIVSLYDRAVKKTVNLTIKSLPSGVYRCRCGNWHLTSAYDNRSEKTKFECEIFLDKMPRSKKKRILHLLHKNKKKRETFRFKKEDSSDGQNAAQGENIAEN